MGKNELKMYYMKLSLEGKMEGGDETENGREREREWEKKNG